MKTYFFGVISPQEKGHFLYGREGGYRLGPREEEQLPFRATICDGGLLPPCGVEEQGKHYLSHINGWTILSMWDRTGDSRGKSCASFIVEGIHTHDQAAEVAALAYPNLWKRIHPLT